MSLVLEKFALPLPPRKTFARDEYERLAETGFFDGQRVELLEGDLFVMSPMGTRHNVGVNLADETLTPAFKPGYSVRVQSSFRVPIETELEPDLAVVPGKARDYLTHNPDNAVLIVEIADSSLEYDLTTKAALYARAGVPEYWVVNLAASVLVVHRDPGPMAEAPLGFGYGTIFSLSAGQTLPPLAAPNTSLAVSDLLP